MENREKEGRIWKWIKDKRKGSKIRSKEDKMERRKNEERFIWRISSCGKDWEIRKGKKNLIKSEEVMRRWGLGRVERNRKGWKEKERYEE